MNAPAAPAHYRRVEKQHEQKNSFLNNYKPQFGIYPLNRNCESREGIPQNVRTLGSAMSGGKAERVSGIILKYKWPTFYVVIT